MINNSQNLSYRFISQGKKAQDHHPDLGQKVQNGQRYLSVQKRHDPFFEIFQREIDDFQSTKSFENRNKYNYTRFPRLFEKNSRIKFAQEILEEKEVFVQNEVLKRNIEKLKEMNLIQDKNLRIKSFKASGKSEFVLNDFHLRATNPGYSRNNLGSFYTK